MITLEIDGQIVHIKLDRAEKLNAMNWAFWEGMPGIIEQINANLDIRAAVLSGEGKAFCVGLDFFDVMPKLGVGGAGPEGERQRHLHQIIREMQWAVTSVERCRVPVIAAVTKNTCSSTVLAFLPLMVPTCFQPAETQS